jgi:hypothetical protein
MDTKRLTFRFVLLGASAIACALLVGTVVMGETLPGSGAEQRTDFQLNESGQILLPVSADTTEGPEEGLCLADAIALLNGDKVESIQQQGTSSVVKIGESVKRIGNDHSYDSVYRDEAGVLHQGCAPESSDTFKPPADYDPSQ